MHWRFLLLFSWLEGSFLFRAEEGCLLRIYLERDELPLREAPGRGDQGRGQGTHPFQGLLCVQRGVARTGLGLFRGEQLMCVLSGEERPVSRWRFVR